MADSTTEVPAEAPQAEPVKAEVPKVETHKAESPKAESTKSESPKAEGKKSKRSHGPQAFWGLGRRKCATARVRLLAGSGKMTFNGREASEFFNSESNVTAIRHPLELVGMLGKLDVLANVRGGGTTGQSGAIALGVARALTEMNPEFRPPLSKAGLLTRDPRMVERKKVGRRGARRGFQWCKR